MPAPIESSKTFADEFLEHYLKNGIGAMPKSDVDSLVMYLLDKYSHNAGVPLQSYSNQVVSETLRAPLARVKRLRYEAGLKYGGRAEDEARRRFVVCLSKASVELEKETGSPSKMLLIIEDTLAKHWIQGQIKEHGLVFDGSFNSEIVKVEPRAFFAVLCTLLDKASVDAFEKKFRALEKQKKGQAFLAAFGELLKSFLNGVAGQGGGVVAAALVALPIFGG
jgi:hypothetical protein